jgi:hypothetical protein
MEGFFLTRNGPETQFPFYDDDVPEISLCSEHPLKSNTPLLVYHTWVIRHAIISVYRRSTNVSGYQHSVYGKPYQVLVKKRQKSKHTRKSTLLSTVSF